jgi:uncharacterized protein DUF4013
MSQPATTASMVDIGHAFGFVFRSKNWFGKLAVGALCLLFFWVLLIPVFILNGYFVETARHVKGGGRDLPPWVDVGKKLREGFVLAVVLFIWSLPGSILSGGGQLTCTGSTCVYHPGALSALGGLYSLALGLLTPAIWSQYLDGGFSGAFDFRSIFRRAGFQPGVTVLVWLMAIVAGIVGALGLIIVLIGVLFTLPYAFAVIANLYGQYARATEQVAQFVPASG